MGTLCAQLLLQFSLQKLAHAIYRDFFSRENWKFSAEIFLIFARNIDCGYMLEPPRRGGSNEYPQSMFWSKNRYTPAYPSFAIWKWGLRGHLLLGHVFLMIPILFKLYRCCDHALKICMWFVYNPQINFCHFFRNLNLAIFRAFSQWKWMGSGHLVCATPPTVSCQFI